MGESRGLSGGNQLGSDCRRSDLYSDGSSGCGGRCCMETSIKVNLTLNIRFFNNVANIWNKLKILKS